MKSHICYIYSNIIIYQKYDYIKMLYKIILLLNMLNAEEYFLKEYSKSSIKYILYNETYPNYKSQQKKIQKYKKKTKN